MKRYMERLLEIIGKYPDRTAFVKDEDYISYRGLWEESGRVYAWLKERTIGREQFVQLIMPRDAHFFSAMLGVMRAGAAYVLIEEGYPKERTEYIRRDLECVQVIDKALLDQILIATEPLEGYEETRLHDASYAVYTSGSTGNPKGVIHEYGNVDQCASMEPELAAYEEHRFVFTPSLNFVATQLYLIPATVTAYTSYIMDRDLIRDFTALQEFFTVNQIESVFLPPSYLRSYHSPAPTLTKILTGSAPAYDIYYPDGIPAVENTYGMSETGFFVFRGILERAYENAPVGNPTQGIDMCLVTDDGCVLVDEPGVGELCLVNEYVRGYVKLPELTARAFCPVRAGGPVFFHTGDIFRRDEDGKYYVAGRMDDMIKIDGNRIEPAEIETAIKRCTGLSEVMAKGFVEKDRAYIAAYYLEKEAQQLGLIDSAGALRIDGDRLASMLPSYMIPTYYVPLSAFPVNANGKLTRKELSPPDLDSMRSEYVAPRSETERLLCEEMARILGTERVGIHDDFLAIGGDSMRSIELITACSDINMSVSDIYRFRTPEKIAARIEEYREDTSIGEEDPAVRRKAWPLMPAQQQMLDYEKCGPYEGYLDMPKLLRFNTTIDEKRLADALNRCLPAHPALYTRIFRDEDGVLKQTCDESFLVSASVQEVSEAEFEEIRKHFSDPYIILDAPLTRCGIYKTPNAVWLYLSIHHVMMDGSGMHVLMEHIREAYENENAVCKTDHFYSILQRAESAAHFEECREAKAWYEDRYRKFLHGNFCFGIRPDRPFCAGEGGIYINHTEFERKQESSSQTFLAACALAQAWYNAEDGAMLMWTYSDRSDLEKIHVAGPMFAHLPLCVTITRDFNPDDLLQDVQEQTAFGMAHPEYCWLRETYGDYTCMTRFIYQKDTLAESPLEEMAEENQSINLIDVKKLGGVVGINIVDTSGSDRIGLIIRYLKTMYDESSILRYIELIHKALDLLP